MNERSSWQEVWRIKTKLEALTEHAQMKKKRDAHTQDGPAISSDESAVKAPPAPQILTYSSLKEWESMSTIELELLVSTQELKLVQFINDKLLPLLPMANCPIHIMQTVYELAGLTKPIYVKF